MKTKSKSSGLAASLNYKIAPETHKQGDQKLQTHVTLSIVNSTFAQPGMKPGALVNHRITSRTKMVSTAISANFIGPSFLYSFSITLYPSLSLSDRPPQPKVCFRLQRGEKKK